MSTHPTYSLSFANWHLVGEEHSLLMEQEQNDSPKYKFKNTGIDTRKILIEGDMLCSETIVYVTKYMKGFFDDKIGLFYWQ